MPIVSDARTVVTDALPHTSSRHRRMPALKRDEGTRSFDPQPRIISVCIFAQTALNWRRNNTRQPLPLRIATAVSVSTGRPKSSFWFADRAIYHPRRSQLQKPSATCSLASGSNCARFSWFTITVFKSRRSIMHKFCFYSIIKFICLTRKSMRYKICFCECAGVSPPTLSVRGEINVRET